MFWELRTIAAAISGDGLADWKATVTIILFEIFAIVGLTNAAAVYLGRRLVDKGSPFIFLVAISVAIINTPAIVGKHERWDRYSKDFENYPKFARIAGGIAVVLLVVGSVFVAGHFGAAQRHLPR